MTPEGIALILGAVATLTTAVSTAIVLILKAKVSQVSTSVAEVHQLVNQNRTDMLAYQQDLVAALQAGGLLVPRDKSTE
jgi:outer membrane murein-binding lipoprotein Lpp